MAEPVLERIKRQARAVKEGGLPAAAASSPQPTGPAPVFPDQPKPYERPLLERLRPAGENPLLTGFAAPFRLMTWLGDQESRYIIEPFYGATTKALAWQLDKLPEPVRDKVADIAQFVEQRDIGSTPAPGILREKAGITSLPAPSLAWGLPFLGPMLAMAPTDEIARLARDDQLRQQVREGGVREAYQRLADQDSEFFWRTQLLSPVTVASLALMPVTGGTSSAGLASKFPFLGRAAEAVGMAGRATRAAEIASDVGRAARAADVTADTARTLSRGQRALQAIRVPFDLYDEAYAVLMRPYVWITRDVVGRPAWWGVKTAGRPLLRPVRALFERTRLSERIQESRMFGSILRRNLRETGRPFVDDYDRLVGAENEAIAARQVPLDSVSDPQLVRYWETTGDQEAQQVLQNRGLLGQDGELTAEARKRLELDDELIRLGRFNPAERTLAQLVLDLVYRVAAQAAPNQDARFIWQALDVKKVADGSILRGETGLRTVQKGDTTRLLYEVKLGPEADITTLVHEFAHLIDFLAPAEFREALLRNFGERTSDGALAWTSKSAEDFALAFEQWLFSGTSRIPEIDRMMQAFRDQAELSYFRGTPGVEMPEEVSRYFESLYGGDQAPDTGPVPPGPVPPGPGPETGTRTRGGTLPPSSPFRAFGLTDAPVPSRTPVFGPVPQAASSPSRPVPPEARVVPGERAPSFWEGFIGQRPQAPRFFPWQQEAIPEAVQAEAARQVEEFERRFRTRQAGRLQRVPRAGERPQFRRPQPVPEAVPAVSPEPVLPQEAAQQVEEFARRFRARRQARLQPGRPDCRAAAVPARGHRSRRWTRCRKRPFRLYPRRPFRLSRRYGSRTFRLHRPCSIRRRRRCRKPARRFRLNS